MSEKHLQAGDPLPSYGDKIRVFSMRFCPFAQRVVLVLNAKGIPYDVVYINLDNKPDWYKSINPLGTVPALEIEPGTIIYDSNIVNGYLEEQYPSVRLTSDEPLRKAQDKLIVEHFAPIIPAFYAGALNPDNLSQDAIDKYNVALEYIQNVLVTRGTKFLFGDQAGLVDYSIWPWFERLEALPLLGVDKLVIDKSKYDVLTSWIEAMKITPAVKQYLLAPDTHSKFLETKKKGSADFDILNTSNACCYRPKKKPAA